MFTLPQTMMNWSEVLTVCSKKKLSGELSHRCRAPILAEQNPVEECACMNNLVKHLATM